MVPNAVSKNNSKSRINLVLNGNPYSDMGSLNQLPETFFNIPTFVRVRNMSW